MHKNQQSIPVPSISFDKPEHDGKRYRSIATYPTQSHLPSPSIPEQNELICQQKRVIITNQNYTKCKPQTLSFSINSIAPDLDLQPLDILTTSVSMSIEDSIDSSCSPRSFPPSLATNSSHSAASYYNDINSYFVPNADAIQTLNTLHTILSNYKDEIEFETNAKMNTIEGLVFFSNICINFSIFVWSLNANQCRIEFRRTSGDAMAAAKFWSQIKGTFEKQPQLVSDFIDLELEAMAFESDNEDVFDESELDALTQAMIENDLYVVDELTFFYEAMRKNIDICHAVLAHGEFLKQLISESMQNKDVCVVRIALLILEQLATIKDENTANLMEFDLFLSLNATLKHERGLIRKCTMKILAIMCEDDSEWMLEDDLRAEMIENVQICEIECGKEVADKICAKLMLQ